MDNPLCEYCKARGHITPATVCDHDLPHDHDPQLFWDNTFTALCKWDHDSTKQRMERRYSGDALLQAVGRAKTDGGNSRRVRVDSVPNAGAILVWGSPASGKSTWARAKAKDNGAVIYDLDDIAEGIGMPRYGRTRQQWQTSMDAMFSALSKHDASRRLIFINTGATVKRRQFWASLLNAGEAHMVHADMSTCIDRVKLDPQRCKHAASQIETIKDWFASVESGL